VEVIKINIKEKLNQIAVKLGSIGIKEEQKEEGKWNDEKSKKYGWMIIAMIGTVIVLSLITVTKAELVTFQANITGMMTAFNAMFGNVFQNQVKCVNLLNSTNSGFWVAIRLLNTTQSQNTTMFEMSIKHLSDPTVPTEVLPLDGSWLNITSYSPGTYQLCFKGTKIGTVSGFLEIQKQDGVNITIQ
jgi:hypothetical protein